MASFWDLLPASLLGQPPASGWPYADPLDSSSPFVAARRAGGSKAAAPNSDSASVTSAPPQTRPLTFWDLLPATPHAQPFVPTMPPTRQLDPWLTPAIRPAPVTAGAQAFFPGADRATPPGFLGLALGQSALGGEPSSATSPFTAGQTIQQSPSIIGMPGVDAVPTGVPFTPPPLAAGALGAGAEDRESFIAPWSASHGLLDYPVIGPVAGLSEYLMRGAARSWQDRPWLSDEEATAPNRYYLPRPGERSPPSRYSAAPLGDLLADMIEAPFLATHDMMQPPLRPPPDSESMMAVKSGSNRGRMAQHTIRRSLAESRPGRGARLLRGPAAPSGARASICAGNDRRRCEFREPRCRGHGWRPTGSAVGKSGESPPKSR
jgi:hypothetical protein